MPTTQEKIEFYKLREFSDKVNVTFAFIKGHFKSLVKIALLIGVPLGLLSGIALSFFARSMTSFQEENPLFGLAGASYLVMVFGAVIGISFLTSALYSYMDHYHLHGESLDTFEVLKKASSKVPGLILLFFVTSLLTAVGSVFFIIPGLYVGIVLSLSFPSYVFVGTSVGASISRSFKLIKGKWWSTFGLLFVTGMLGMMVGYVFAIPYYILLIGKAIAAPDDPSLAYSAYQGWEGALSASLMLIGSYIGYLVPLIALAFQFFNLSERLDSTGLKKQIENFDQIG